MNSKNKKKSKNDSGSNFVCIHDAVHGPIDLREVGGLRGNQSLAGILNSPMMDRLRRIKQLGYASHSYLSADHSRYAHALGTMYVMRSLLKHLADIGEDWAQTLKSLRNFGAPYVQTPEGLQKHMILAGLLQDVGELPYNMATMYLYKPSDNLRETVANFVGYDIGEWEDKDVFTVASIYTDTYCKSLNLNLSLLTFLITGHSNVNKHNLIGLAKLRHMLDGEVDADRLDYVFRDAHHTIGARGTPTAVIDSLLYYDDEGPVFSDPGPVLEFLTTRASMWATVYYSPLNRFRTLLLITLLQGITENDECSKDFFGPGLRGELSLDDFNELDDISLNSSIVSLAKKDLRKRLNARAQNALDILMGRSRHSAEYDCVWLPRPSFEQNSTRRLIIPDDLFFDTSSHFQEHHTIYKHGGVRIKADRFKYYKDVVPLDECSGAFSQIFKQPTSVAEKADSILLFLPKNKTTGSWKQITQAIENGQLYESLIESDPIGHLNLPEDTRKLMGYKGVDLFISYAFSDRKIVHKIIHALLRRKRRYFVYIKDFQGVGAPPGLNSVRAVEAADAILIVASTNYVKKYREEPDGNIAKEIWALADRVKRGQVKLAILSADDFQSIELPWTQLGYADEPPFIGKPLRNATSKVVVEAVDAVLRHLDEG